MTGKTDSAIEIEKSYNDIKAKGLLASSGRPFTIVAISKTFGYEMVEQAYLAGLRDFGENYADELLIKAQSSHLLFREDPIRWHYVGAIQSRSIAKLAPFVSVWHSVARSKEIELISKVSPGARIFIQIKYGEAQERNGISLERASELVSLGVDKGLSVLGLMVVPPVSDYSMVEKVFIDVNSERQRLGLPFASMGMSEDFELALSCGSTHIRIGRALFGSRSDSNRPVKGQGGPR